VPRRLLRQGVRHPPSCHVPILVCFVCGFFFFVVAPLPHGERLTFLPRFSPLSFSCFLPIPLTNLFQSCSYKRLYATCSNDLPQRSYPPPPTYITPVHSFFFSFPREFFFLPLFLSHPLGGRVECTLFFSLSPPLLAIVPPPFSPLSAQCSVIVIPPLPSTLV